MPFDDIEVSARILLLVIGVFLSVTVFASIYNGYTSGEGIPGPVFVTFIMTRMITCIFLLELLAQMVDRFAPYGRVLFSSSCSASRKNGLL